MRYPPDTADNGDNCGHYTGDPVASLSDACVLV